ncbi:FMN-binding domain-containing protein [Actinopolymorpha cephalotaxi]|uniref:FMN-binding domain-containing protein n=1 Tax=Actinopolymorpha cephalotaxi TaxID=504797 RepID=A0A1I2KKF9_9ACTN|nr:FMN-binding protein [Actinopolymorpha cephalotaxi]NYH81166.1 uncharacterized protein with FMN-binding domain [Actinopolymorpha cephalotaxi]SFF65436.1 FMN-binding domain-containing protein [Actinopolymorpha cephalotaxi]
MKRIVLTALTTITGIVLLLGVKSQTGAPGLATLAAPGAGSGSTATKRTSAPRATPTPTATVTPTPTGTPTPRKKKLTTKKKSSTSKAKATPRKVTHPRVTPKPKPKPVTRMKVAGQTADTPYGPVQVKVTMLGHRITDVTALQLPGGNQRSSEIAGFAAPQLRKEALSAQSAHIDSVSGATYTSQGYITSLQSALDRAGA